MAEYIDREAVADSCKRMIQDTWNSATAPVSWAHAYADFLDIVENILAADVAPVVHGHWEIVTGSNGKTYMVCSECRKQQTLIGTFSYCPNCGAKMDGDSKEVNK